MASYMHLLTPFGLSEPASATLARTPAQRPACLSVHAGPVGRATQTSFAIFAGSFAVSFAVLSRKKRVAALARENREKCYLVPPSQLHAVVVCVNALVVALGSDNDILAADKVYGSTELSRWTNAFACGYFLYDFFVVLFHLPIDVKFLIHAIVCGLAFWFSQAPLFQYYTTRFLLFELSTPMLNFKNLSQVLDWPKTWQTVIGNMFAASFVGCRLVYGLPMSYDFVTFLWDLFTKQRDPTTYSVALPSPNMLAFSIFAITSMSGLNVLWVLLAALGKTPTEHEVQTKDGHPVKDKKK